MEIAKDLLSKREVRALAPLAIVLGIMLGAIFAERLLRPAPDAGVGLMYTMIQLGVVAISALWYVVIIGCAAVLVNMQRSNKGGNKPQGEKRPRRLPEASPFLIIVPMLGVSILLGATLVQAFAIRDIPFIRFGEEIVDAAKAGIFAVGGVWFATLVGTIGLYWWLMMKESDSPRKARAETVVSAETVAPVVETQQDDTVTPEPEPVYETSAPETIISEPAPPPLLNVNAPDDAESRILRRSNRTPKRGAPKRDSNPKMPVRSPQRRQ